MADAFSEIVAKFDRAYEHIDSLKIEVARLLENVPSRPIAAYDPAERQAFQQQLNRIVVPTRTRIIAGEAIHQMRSSLDHLVAKLVAANNGNTTNRTEFPIQSYRPTKPKEVRSYEKKLEGVADAPKALIESLQPYQFASSERESTPLAILKRLDNRDKHHEPVLSIVHCKPTMRIVVAGDPMEYIPDNPCEAGPTIGGDIVDVRHSLTPHVVFPQFGIKQNQLVVDGLIKLFAYTKLNVVQQFRQYL